MGDNNLSKWGDLTAFQSQIAERWLKRGNEINDVFAKFFFYFTGFNALYFLWATIYDVRNSEGEPAGERLQINKLVEMLKPQEATYIFEQTHEQVVYFRDRFGPIQRMGKRIGRTGDEREGKKWQRILHDAI